jgi:toxin ParE1/3/4
LEELWPLKLRYTRRARADIAEIFKYISQHNMLAATAVVSRIRATSELLAEHPVLGRQTNVPGVRVFPISRYPFLVYHRVSGDELVVLHVRHARRTAPGIGEF